MNLTTGIVEPDVVICRTVPTVSRSADIRLGCPQCLGWRHISLTPRTGVSSPIAPGCQSTARSFHAH
jgi:hypothetical protein